MLCAACLTIAAASARAQDAPPRGAAPPLVPLQAPAGSPSPGPAGSDTDASAPPAAVPPAAVPPLSLEAAQLEAVRAWTAQLLEIERRTQQVEQERERIRFIGVRIGKYLSWTATALFLSSALNAYGRAEAVKKALKDGRDDEFYDTDRDDDVDKQDERHSRRIARALLFSSVVPIGLGVFSTMLERKRRKQHRMLSYQLEDFATQRRALISRLGAQLGVAPGHASLQLRLAF